MAKAIFWTYPNMQINAWDKAVEGHYYTIAVVQSNGRIISSEDHCCPWRSTGAHCGNDWEGAVKDLYLKLKAKAALGFNAFSQAKLKLKAEAVSKFDAFMLVNY